MRNSEMTNKTTLTLFAQVIKLILF